MCELEDKAIKTTQNKTQGDKKMLKEIKTNQWTNLMEHNIFIIEKNKINIFKK